jgi:hypothetical protein
METYANVKLLSCENRSFTSDSGEAVRYFVNYVKGIDDNSSVIEISSKADFSELEGQTGVVRLRVRPLEKGVKLSIAAFTPNETIQAPEEIIR